MSFYSPIERFDSIPLNDEAGGENEGRSGGGGGLLHSVISRRKNSEQSSHEKSGGLLFGFIPWRLARIIFMTALLTTLLGLTYDKCIGCVLGIAIVSGLTMNCIPTMPLVFVLCLLVLLYHAIDYRRATIRVEVPLKDVVYMPTWSDLKQYVNVDDSQKGVAGQLRRRRYM